MRAVSSGDHRNRSMEIEAELLGGKVTSIRLLLFELCFRLFSMCKFISLFVHWRVETVWFLSTLRRMCVYVCVWWEREKERPQAMFEKLFFVSSLQ